MAMAKRKIDKIKTKYKHIHFVNYGIENGKRYYACENNKSDTHLGTAYFYPTWRKYVFVANEYAIFDESCLQDVCHFLGQLK